MPVGAWCMSAFPLEAALCAPFFALPCARSLHARFDSLRSIFHLSLFFLCTSTAHIKWFSIFFLLRSFRFAFFHLLLFRVFVGTDFSCFPFDFIGLLAPVRQHNAIAFKFLVHDACHVDMHTHSHWVSVVHQHTYPVSTVLPPHLLHALRGTHSRPGYTAVADCSLFPYILISYWFLVNYAMCVYTTSTKHVRVEGTNSGLPHCVINAMYDWLGKNLFKYYLHLIEIDLSLFPSMTVGIFPCPALSNVPSCQCLLILANQRLARFTLADTLAARDILTGWDMEKFPPSYFRFSSTIRVWASKPRSLPCV